MPPPSTRRARPIRAGIVRKFLCHRAPAAGMLCYRHSEGGGRGLVGSAENRVYRFGSFRFETAHGLLYRGKDAVPLAPKVAETLAVLLEARGRVVDKTELMRRVWPDAVVEEIGLARNISQLRKALGDDGSAAPFVETLPKRGYRFAAQVELDEQGSPSPPPRRRRWRWLTAALLFAAALFLYWLFYRPSRFAVGADGRASLSVIPFECRGQGLDCSVFGKELNDLLVADLSGFDVASVLSPSTVRSFQRARLSTAFMNRILGIDLTLEGSFVRLGERARVTARLVDVRAARLIWSQSYDYPANEPAAAQAEAAQSIAAQVAAHLVIRHGFSPLRR